MFLNSHWIIKLFDWTEGGMMDSWETKLGARYCEIFGWYEVDVGVLIECSACVTQFREQFGELERVSV